MKDMSHKFDWVEYTAFFFTLGLSACIGFYFGFIKKSQNTLSDYLFGGKNMSMLPIILSLIASHISGNVFIGAPAETYMFGAQYLLWGFTVLIAGLITIYVFIPVYDKLKIFTPYEYLGLRFGDNIRIATSIIFILNNFLFLPLVIYAPALAVNQGLNIYILTTIMSAICIFYTTVGGLKAVVWSDTLQAIIMVCSITIVTILGIIEAGGVPEIIRKANEGGRLNLFDFNPDPTLRQSFWTSTIGVLFISVALLALRPANMQRFISLGTKERAQKAVFYYMFGSVFFMWLSGLIGIIIYAYYKDCDPYTMHEINKPDQIFPYFVMEVAAKIRGLPGVFFVGLVSAALSTMSTALNTSGGIIYNEFIKRTGMKIKENKESLIVKITVILLGITAVLLVSVVQHMGQILELTTTFEGVTLGVNLGLVLLGLFFPKANSKGALIGCISSLLVMAWLMIGSKIAKAQGFIKHYPLALSIDNCTVNSTTQIIVFPSHTEDVYVFPLYKISAYYYGMIGCMLSLLIGLGASYITGKNKPENLSKDLYSPLIHKYLPIESKDPVYTSIPLKTKISL